MNVDILAAQGITKQFDGFAALTDVDIILRKGERVGLIGPNGSGKSTLVNCLTGIITPDSGSIIFDGNDITATAAWVRAKHGLARTYQIPRPFRSMTVQENIEVPLRFAVGHTSARTIGNAAQVILDQVGLADKADRSPKVLDASGVEETRARPGACRATEGPHRRRSHGGSFG